MLIQNIDNQALGFPSDRMAGGRLVGTGGAESVVAATTTAGGSPAQSAPKPAPAQLKSAVGAANNAMRQANLNLEFVVDPDTQQPIIKMVDNETGQVIRQIPSEEMLAISRSIEQYQQGLLLRQKA